MAPAVATQRTMVTGAFSFTGAFVAQELLRRGHSVLTMTSHPTPPGPWAASVASVPYRFDDAAALRRSLVGTQTLVNTYWIRFPRNGLDFRDAVENIRILCECATEADVRRFVHVSVSNPSADSPFPYYRGKAAAEQAVRRAAPSWGIVRPTLLFASNDILLNNMAWLLRHFPVFALPGDGLYRVQPVSGGDVGRIVADVALDDADVVQDAAGPQVLSFREVVAMLRSAVHSKARVVQTPSPVALGLAKMAGLLVRDVVLTRYELGGLAAELLVSAQPPLGTETLGQGLASYGAGLGARYHSELDRHFRGIDAAPFRRFP